MITMTLTDDTTSVELEMLEVPLSEEVTNNDVEVTTLDNNISVYIYPDSDKRTFSHTWRYASQDFYDIVKGFRDRQRTLFKYPRVTIPDQGVTDIPVLMKMGIKDTIDNCGEVEGLSITLRESAQMS